MNLKSGDTIGNRFTILRELGAGGVGAVYLAHDRERDRDVAFKVLLPRFAGNPLAMERFKREANICRELKHPAIVAIYDRGRIGEALFYTMEYVKGTPLDVEMKRRGRFGVAETVSIVSAVAEALDHAHQTAIHRDLSPDNIVLLDDNAIKLLDFGQGKAINDSSGLTSAGMPMGKLLFAAPELRTDAREADRRADIYSLGAIAYAMLTGKGEFAFRPIRDRFPDVSEECERAVAKAMAVAPADRYDSATAFATDLGAGSN